MAVAMSRTSLCQLGARVFLPKSRQAVCIARITPVICTQVANNSNKAYLTATYGEKYPYHPNPFPYETKKYTQITEWFDGTDHRLNSNSKIITVEGNVAVGKNEFAKRLAKQFDMMYMPSVPIDNCFTVDAYGYDIRSFNELLPDVGKYYDIDDWLTNPHPKVARLEIRWFREKVYGYLKAMQHVLSTGQGVVVANSPFGQTGFLEAMKRFGHISRPAYKFFCTVRDDVLIEMCHPHVMIYLEAPTNVVRERINKRNRPVEVNSKVLTDDFLTEIDRSYKEVCLPWNRKHSEVLEIDWSTELDDLDIETIAEEMTRIKLEPEDNEDPKFMNWNLTEDEFARIRRFAVDKERYLSNLMLHQIPTAAPEMFDPEVEPIVLNRIVYDHPVIKYEQGWAPELGHKTHFKLF